MINSLLTGFVYITVCLFLQLFSDMAKFVSVTVRLISRPIITSARGEYSVILTSSVILNATSMCGVSI